MKRTLTWTVACLLVLLAGRASAEEPTFGDAGHVAISAERLFGYVHASRTQTVAGTEMTASQDYFTLLTNPVGAVSGYGWPRIGIDAFVTRGLSIGGALGFFYLSDQVRDSSTGFLLAPRIGYALPVGPSLAIWPRAGVSTWHVSNNPSGTGTDSSSSAVAVTIEVPVTILLAPRVAFTIGPTVDIGVGGSSLRDGRRHLNQRRPEIHGHRRARRLAPVPVVAFFALERPKRPRSCIYLRGHIGGRPSISRTGARRADRLRT